MGGLHDIWRDGTRGAAAGVAMIVCAEKDRAKDGRAASCKVDDREALLAVRDFPADRRDHLRTGIPIESVFATVRHPTVRTRGASSQGTATLMIFMLVRPAAQARRGGKSHARLPQVIEGVAVTGSGAVRDTDTGAARARSVPQTPSWPR